MISCVLLLSFLVRHVTCGGNEPSLQWDPDTVADCMGWYDNDGSLSCEEALDLFGVTPEEFHVWNPSVGPNCSWDDWQSYCIITQEKIDALPATTTIATAISPTTTSVIVIPIPDPTAWVALGCYAEIPEDPILQLNMDPDGNGALTISECENTCWLSRFKYAGVQQGNQCWCDAFLGGERTRNQSDCDMPCTGDDASTCGGKGFLNIFKAEFPATTSTNAIESTQSVESKPGQTTTTGMGEESTSSPTPTAKTGAATRNYSPMSGIVHLIRLHR